MLLPAVHSTNLFTPFYGKSVLAKKLTILYNVNIIYYNNNIKY